MQFGIWRTLFVGQRLGKQGRLQFYEGEQYGDFHCFLWVVKGSFVVYGKITNSLRFRLK